MDPLSTIQVRALEFVESCRDELIDLARRLVATPSPSPPGDERAVACVARDQLADLGLTDNTIVGPRPERANLICRYDSGRPGSTLLLNGHLDTKPAGRREAWEVDPYEGLIRDGRLYGLGSADMKGPDAALIFGLAAAIEAGADVLRGQVLLILSADEEGQARDGAQYLVQEAGIRADAALIAEPCGVLRSWEMLPLISRGFCGVRFTIQGTQTHSSIGDRLPVVNASLDASRLLVFLHEHLHLAHRPSTLCPQGPTVNLGATLSGGQALAMVSGHAEFTADIRTLPGMTQAQVARDIERALAAFSQEQTQASVSYDFVPGNLGWTEPTQIEADQPLVRAVQAAAGHVLGEMPPLGCFPGGTDAVWWQGAAGIPTIPGFGPGLLSHAHQPNEFIDLEEIVQAAKIYALTILKYFGEG